MKQIFNRNHCLSWRSAHCCLPRIALWLQEKPADSIAWVQGIAAMLAVRAFALISVTWCGVKSPIQHGAAVRPAVVRLKLIT